jgi:glycosyltransferase involved in cell wall biosynthesis
MIFRDGEPLRVAFFTDCFHEINGVAHTSRQLHDYARREELPFFSLHAGPETRVFQQGSVTVCELKRSRWAWTVDADLSFDPLFQRHWQRVREALEAFQPDLIHTTSLGDCSILGAALAHELRLPLVISWHTNLHEFGACRLLHALRFVAPEYQKRIKGFLEPELLRSILHFYRIGKVLLAPNPELISLLERRTGRRTYLMQRGVDTDLFSPARRNRNSSTFVLGYVGRLSVEKNVRFLVEIERALLAAGETNFRFVVVGQGDERDWLRDNLKHAEFPGVLRGEALADAYANFDLFVFPSHTDTFGNVVLESLASGVPVLTTGSGGPRFLVQHGVTGFVARQPEDFARRACLLINDRPLRETMSRSAREYALTMSWDRVFERVYRSYRACFEPADGLTQRAALATRR